MARPWLHAMGIVPSTVHLKVKYLSMNRVEELVGSQSMARQCMVVAIRHQTGGKSSAFIGTDFVAIKVASAIHGSGGRGGEM